MRLLEELLGDRIRSDERVRRTCRACDGGCQHAGCPVQRSARAWL